MMNARFSLKGMLSNVRLVGSLVVLTLAIAMFLVQKTEATNAFLVSMNNIKMGVGTDKWAPPATPTILGYKTVDAAPTAPFTACETMTDQEQVVFSWKNTPAELKTIAKYYVGTPADPKMATYNSKATSAKFALAEAANQLQVIAVDNRGTESLPAICAITADRIAPTVSLTQPTATLSGTLVEMAATISEVNLKSALFEIKDTANAVVATGGAVAANPTNASESALTYSWSAASFSSGAYTIVARATDQVGHVTTTEKQIALDTLAPESTLTMTVPVASNSGLLTNGGFEEGLTNWTVQGDVLTSNSTAAVKPQQGSGAVVLGSQNTASQVSLVSYNLSAVANQVQTVGFWYNLNPKNGVAATEGMMVFVGDEMVRQEWLTNQTAGWRYLQLNVAGVADPTVTVAYTHDSDTSTGGELYLDGFTTNHSFELNQISFLLGATDNTALASVHASYVVNGQTVALTNPTKLTFSLETMPDDQQISFWAVDSVGNVEVKQSMQVPTLSSTTVQPSVEPTPSPSPSPSPSDEPATESASLKPVVTIADKKDYHFELAITNLKPAEQVQYIVAYAHGTDASNQIQDAIQGTGTVAADATSLTASGLYFGTCSSTAGIVCEPHVGVTDIIITVTVTNPTTGVVTEYQFAYPGVWTTESSNEAV